MNLKTDQSQTANCLKHHQIVALLCLSIFSLTTLPLTPVGGAVLTTSGLVPADPTGQMNSEAQINLGFFTSLGLPFDSVYVCVRVSVCVCVSERENKTRKGGRRGEGRKQEKKNNILNAYPLSGCREELLPPESCPDPHSPRPHPYNQLSRINPSPRSAQTIRPPAVFMLVIFRSLSLHPSDS